MQEPPDHPSLVKEEDSGLSIRRVFLGLGGKPADPNALEQGKLYHVQWTIRTARAVENLVIADLLARMTPTDQELKLGVFTALVGAPLFAMIAWRAAREWRL
jgi:hypothetical protein